MKLATTILLLGLLNTAFGAPFANLGFDLANTNTLSVQPGPILQGTGPSEDLLPGWQLAKGGTPQPTLGLNLALLSFGYATLISADQGDMFGFPVEGQYALHLVGTQGNTEPFSLSQRGEIPADAQFFSYRYSGFGFQLNLNGTELRPTGQTPSTELFDISKFSGQTVELRLTALGPLMPMEAGASFIDSVAFTIPEPSTSTLLAIGTALLWLARRVARRHFR